MNRVILPAVRGATWTASAALAVPGARRRHAPAWWSAGPFANLHRELKHHHEQEDGRLPGRPAWTPASTCFSTMDDEHHAMAAALAEPAGAMETYAATGSAADAAAARSERRAHHGRGRPAPGPRGVLEPLMLPHLETAEWKQVEKALRKQSPATSGRFFAWLTDGMAPRAPPTCARPCAAPVVPCLRRCSAAATTVRSRRCGQARVP